MSRSDDAPGWGRRWSPFLAGTAAGLAAGVLLRWAGGERPFERLAGVWDGIEEAAGGLAEGLHSARELVAARPPLDGAALTERIRELPGDCRVRTLGHGIVEVVGACGSEEDARTVLEAISAEPGVEVVVNRIWTPSSSSPDEVRAQPGDGDS